MNSEPIRIGVIGGSGLYQMKGLNDIHEVRVTTPFGDPSDARIIGRIDSIPVAFLPRHGRGHVLMPTEVPYRANIYALKKLGVEKVISVSACGSLREDLAPGHVVIPDQIFDFTKSRVNSFFGEGLVTEIRGPGDVYIQTKNLREFVDWLWTLLEPRVQSRAR